MPQKQHGENKGPLSVWTNINIWKCCLRCALKLKKCRNKAHLPMHFQMRTFTISHKVLVGFIGCSQELSDGFLSVS